MGINNKEMLLLEKLLNNLSDKQVINVINKLNKKVAKIKNTDITDRIYTSYTLDIEECPHCHSKHIIKKGKYDNKQRYKCKDCNTYFRDNNNTITFNSRKNVNTWIKYLKCFIDRRSLRESSEICNISLPTAFEWRHKILDILGIMMDDIKLNGIVESDETYTRVSYKGNHSKSKNFIMSREIHKRGGEVHTKGLSKEQVCISCFINDNNLSYSKVANLGMPSWNKIYNVIKNHIEEKSILVTDNYKGYLRIVSKLNLNHVPMPEDAYSNGTFNIQKINSYHTYFKRLINIHFRGVATKYLNNYIVYHNFIHCRKDEREKKIIDLQDYVFNTKCNDQLKGNNRPVIPV